MQIQFILHRVETAAQLAQLLNAHAGARPAQGRVAGDGRGGWGAIIRHGDQGHDRIEIRSGRGSLAPGAGFKLGLDVGARRMRQRRHIGDSGTKCLNVIGGGGLR